MEDKLDINFTDTSPYNTVISVNKKDMYPSEVARRILQHALEPYITLENQGYLKGLTVVLYGGTVMKLSQPKDYDLLLLYDSILPFDPSNPLPFKSQRILSSVFPDDSEVVTGNMVFAQDYEGDQRAPEYVEINLRSKTDFLESLHEDEQQKMSRALQKLVWLPGDIIRFYASRDEIYNSEPYVDWNAVDGAAGMWLGIASVLNIKPSENEIIALCASPKLREFIHKHGGEFVSEEISLKRYGLILNALKDNLTELLNDEQKSALEKAVGADIKVKKDIVGQMLREYVQNHKISLNQRNRIMWLFESFTKGISIEDTQVSSGILLYGKNIVQDDKRLFKEDLEYVEF